MPRERIGQLGDFYLFRDRPHGIIYLGWKIPDKNRPGRYRTERESCRTADVEVANEFLADRHAKTREVRENSPNSFGFAELVITYKAQWLDKQNLRSLDQIKRSLRYAVERFGDGHSVFDVGSPELQIWGEKMLEDGRAPGYVQRILNDVRGMYNRAVERRWLISTPKISLKWLGPIEGRDIFANPEQASRFWRAIQDDRLRRFFILAANSGARTERLLALTPENIDLEAGTIDLRKPGERPRDKKRNPVVRITNTLRPWLVNLDDGPIVGVEKRWLYELWRETRKRADVDETFIPTIWRHTLTTILDEQAPEQWVRRWFARASAHQMIDWYTKRRIEHPDFCKPCVSVIDAFMAECDMRPKLSEAGNE